MSVTVNDKIWRQLQARLKSAVGAEVSIGVLDGTHSSGVPLPELAAIHEFGSPANNIPERSFIRSTMRVCRKEFVDQQKKLVKSLLNPSGEHVTTGLDRLGAYVAKRIRERVRGGEITPSLKPATVSRKGSSVPLIDTGQLVKAIKHKVEK